MTLTNDQEDQIIRAITAPDDPPLNFGPLFRLVERMLVAAKAEALREAADEMDNTDDPDAIYVDNGDIDLWLRARVDRLSVTSGEQE